jgi:hypothetical protein
MLGLDRSPQALGVGQAPDAVGLGVLDARRVALHSDAQTLAEIEGLLVLKAELSRQLVHPDPLARHVLLLLLSLLLCRYANSFPRTRAT